MSVRRGYQEVAFVCVCVSMFHCVVLTCGVIWPNDQFKNGIPAVGETDWLLLEEHPRSSRQIRAAKVANNISQLLLCPLIETPTPGKKHWWFQG